MVDSQGLGPAVWEARRTGSLGGWLACAAAGRVTASLTVCQFWPGASCEHSEHSRGNVERLPRQLLIGYTTIKCGLAEQQMCIAHSVLLKSVSESKSAPPHSGKLINTKQHLVQ